MTRTTTCGAVASCLKQSVASAAISANGSRATSSGASLRATATATSTASASSRLSTAASPRGQPVERVADLLERGRGAALGLGDALLLGGGEAVAEALALGLGELDARARPAATGRSAWLAPGAKSCVEQEFGRVRHAMPQ